MRATRKSDMAALSNFPNKQNLHTFNISKKPSSELLEFRQIRNSIYRKSKLTRKPQLGNDNNLKNQIRGMLKSKNSAMPRSWKSKNMKIEKQ